MNDANRGAAGRPEQADYAALAGVVADLDEKVSNLAAQVAELVESAPGDRKAGPADAAVRETLRKVETQLAEVTQQSEQMKATVVEHGRALSAVSASSGRTGAVYPAPCWTGLNDTERAKVMRALYDWFLDILVRRYNVTEQDIPACWWRHPVAVEQLLTLWAAWMAAFKDPDAHTLAAQEWNVRWLPASLGEIRKHLGTGCSFEHNPARAELSHAIVDDPLAFAEVIGGEVLPVAPTAPPERGSARGPYGSY